MLDARLTNATVLTMDPAHPVAGQVGVWNGRIVGVDDDVAQLPARREIDLDGHTVLPGFLDAHAHLCWTGVGMRSASIAPCERADDVLRAIREAAERLGPDDWVDVAGYDQRPLGRHLTAGELDAAGGGRKVFVVHNSGHACVVSSAVLRMLPADVEHDDGVLAESGMAAVRAVRQPYSVDELVAAIEAAGRQCRSEGITTCAEAGIGGGLIAHSAVELAAYQRAERLGRLPLRVQLMVAADALHDVQTHPSDDIRSGLDLGLHTGFGGERLSVGALKVWTDGGMMPRTAALTEPYEGLDHGGQLFGDPQRLTQQIVDGHRAGWQLAVHAIGDAAVDVALAALERAQAEAPRPEARHRIEHAGLVRPDQLARFAAVGATAVVQPNFLTYLGDDYAAIMGERRAPWLYRGQGFLDAGVRLVGSSDRPVTDGSPLRAMQFMLERTTEAGLAVGPDEAIGVQDALRAYTTEAAWACHLEDILGSITPGKLADLVVLDGDPRSAERIGDLRVVTTLLGGVER